MRARYIRKKSAFKSRLLFTLRGDGCVPFKTHTCPINAYSRFNKTTILRGKRHSHDFPERCERRSASLAHVLCAVSMMQRARCTYRVSINILPYVVFLSHTHTGPLIHAPLSHERRLAAPIFELSYNVP